MENGEGVGEGCVLTHAYMVIYIYIHGYIVYSLQVLRYLKVHGYMLKLYMDTKKHALQGCRAHLLHQNFR